MGSVNVNVNVPECVLERASCENYMAWLSAQDGMGHGPIQTGDMGRVTHGIVLETAPAPRDAAWEVCSVFCGRPKCARLRIGKPARKRLVLGTKPACARLKWRQLCEFGKHVAPCEPVYRGPRAACRDYCSRDARSESRGRHSQFRLRGKLRIAVRVRVTSPRIAQHEVRVSSVRWLTWWLARRRAVDAIDGTMLRSHVSPIRKGRVSCKPPPW